ncbi:MAG: hypothetical protein ACFNZJ_00830 [Parascardovia denticolens]
MAISQEELAQVRRLTIKATVCSIAVIQGDQPSVTYENCGEDDFSFNFQEDKLKVKINKSQWKKNHPDRVIFNGFLTIRGTIGTSRKDMYKLTITLPKLDSLKISADAATVKVHGFDLNKLKVEANAATVSIKGCQTRKARMLVDAGAVKARGLNLREDSSFEVNAGSLKLKDCIRPDMGLDVRSTLSHVSLPVNGYSGRGNFYREGSPMVRLEASVGSVNCS